MTGAEREGESSDETTVLCLVGPEAAGKLLGTLRRHYAGAGIEVLEERRSRERRSGSERRKKDKGPPRGAKERRLIRNEDGRRVGERRAALLPCDPPSPLPRKARPYADQIVFCERVPPPDERAEDLDTARLVTRIQANGQDEFAELYNRYFDRVYAYLQVVLRDPHAAEDATQQVFIKVLEAVRRYEFRSQPFRAWLFTIARNAGVSHLRKQGRSEVVAPEALNQKRQQTAEEAEIEVPALGWITDRDLMLFIERLPLAQRQVLTLRYLLDLPVRETAEILGRGEAEVRVLQHRAQRFLRDRLTAMGRSPRHGRRIGWSVHLRQAVVLRERRFALHPHATQ